MINFEDISIKIPLVATAALLFLVGCGTTNVHITPARGTMPISPTESDTPKSFKTEDMENTPSSRVTVPFKTPLGVKNTAILETPSGMIHSNIESIIDDLADRLGVSPADIEVMEVAPEEFPAGDLGCPQPGMTPRPIPAIVTGRRVLLEYEGVIYTYHIHGHQAVFCGDK